MKKNLKRPTLDEIAERFYVITDRPQPQDLVIFAAKFSYNIDWVKAEALLRKIDIKEFRSLWRD